MTIRRLTIADLQIYFGSDGTAMFDARDKKRAAVEQELSEYRDFIDRWLDQSTEPILRRLTPKEVELRDMLKLLTKGLRKHFDVQFIRMLMEQCIKWRGDFGDLSSAQIEEAMAEVISQPGRQ